MHKNCSVVFIDGANLYATGKALKFEIDYALLANYFATMSEDLLRINYYTAVYDDLDDTFRPLVKLIDYLSYNGFNVVTKPVREYTNEQGFKKVKGNMDVEMTVDAMCIAKHISHFHLISGDGDFTYLVRELQRRGIFVSVYSTIKTNPSMVADTLRRQADVFMDLHDLRETFQRT